MASHSPVVINTSSPDCEPIPSATPPSVRQHGSVPASSSSPHLPSPSTFIRPATAKSKEKPKAPGIPDGVNGGFTSAAKLLKIQQLEQSPHFKGGRQDAAKALGKHTTRKDEPRYPDKQTATTSVKDATRTDARQRPEKPAERLPEEISVPSKPSTGKLSRPKKVHRTASPSRSESANARSPLQAFPYQDAARPPGPPPQDMQKKPSTGKLSHPNKVPRTTSPSRRGSANSLSPLQAFAYLDEARAPGSPLSRFQARPVEQRPSSKTSVSLSVYEFTPDELAERDQNTKLGEAAKKPVKVKQKAAETTGEAPAKKRKLKAVKATGMPDLIPAKKAKKTAVNATEKASDVPANRPRKNVPKVSETAGEVPEKKPRKRKFKSESIILNSDEPDDDGLIAYNATRLAQETTTKAPQEPTKLPNAACARAGVAVSTGNSIIDLTNTDTALVSVLPAASEASTYFSKRAEESTLFPRVADADPRPPAPLVSGTSTGRAKSDSLSRKNANAGLVDLTSAAKETSNVCTTLPQEVNTIQKEAHAVSPSPAAPFPSLASAYFGTLPGSAKALPADRQRGTDTILPPPVPQTSLASAYFGTSLGGRIAGPNAHQLKMDGFPPPPVLLASEMSGDFAPVPRDTRSVQITHQAGIQAVGASAADTTMVPRTTTTRGSLLAPHPAAPPRRSPSTSLDSNTPRPCLSSVISGLLFGNGPRRSRSPEKAASGEPSFKRRRIELTDPAPVVLLAESVAKRSKNPRKKPLTITAVATKTYRPAQTADPGQEPTPRKLVDNIAKLKKPRKPRAKKADDAPGAAVFKVPAKPKRAKAPAKKKDVETLAVLYSPTQARAQEDSQGFLFGTSSQLVADDSPTFTRQMQVAIHESEAFSNTQFVVSPQRRSCIKVPSAPHGTSLSIGQAEKDHWCTSARDHDGEILHADSPLPGRAPIIAAPKPETTQEVVSLLFSPRETARYGMPRMLELEPADLPSPVQVDFDADDPENHDDIYDLPVAPEGYTESGVVPEIAQPAPANDWKVISSADSTEFPAHVVPTASLARDLPPIPRFMPSPARPRPALQLLDNNISTARTSPVKSSATVLARPLTTSASFDSRKSPPPALVKRPRGRPRKDSQTVELPHPSPKRQGRPPKLKAAASDLPQKTSQLARPKAAASASQPVTAEWKILDDISDSDTPCTPSPPRRRATSTPPIPKPLDFVAAASPSLKAKASAIVTATLKPTDDSWSAISEKLFADITTAVQSTPPSTDLQHPTWHEKILLYDPIVLEEFTAWLNGQSLRVETQRLKPKAKAKGRKKKDAAVPAELVVAGPEYETCLEELKPWMVQKWCEEKSVCCLWKEGLRGGVKGKY